ncbi:MAG: hypothetical protein J5651_00225 [Salinivirgaceae bacterium]|nr:hypothetical protein [Salinivirgaceae bacterium]
MAQSLADINAKIDKCINFVDGLKGKVFGYTIWAVDTSFNKELQRFSEHYNNYKDRPEERAKLTEKFKNDLLSLTKDSTTANIHVKVVGRGNDEVKLDEEICLKEPYENHPVSRREEQHQQEQPATAQPQPQMPNAQFEAFKQVTNVLTLMGFGGLAGTDDGTGGLNQILTIRDGLNEKRHDDEKKNEKIAQLTADLAVRTQERDQLKAEIEKYEKRIEKANERIEDLEYELEGSREETRKLHPEASLFGTSLTAILTKGIEGFAMRHAAGIGGLFGIDGEALKGALSQPDDSQTLPIEADNDEDSNDPRADQYKMIRDFLKTLSDSEFDDFWQLMRVFNANKETIGIVLTMAKGGGKTAPAEPSDDEQ